MSCSWKYRNSSNNESSLIALLYPMFTHKCIEDNKTHKIIFEFKCHSDQQVQMCKDLCARYRAGEPIEGLVLKDYNRVKAQLLKEINNFKNMKEEKKRRCNINFF